MKIENNRGAIPIQFKSFKKQEAVDISKTQNNSAPDQVATKLSQTLRDVVTGISESGLTAGEVHSNVDETRAAGLLYSMDVDAKRPRLDDDQIVALADKVAKDIESSPKQAVAAFQELDASRVADLVG